MKQRRSSYLLKLVLLLAVCQARGATFTIADGDVAGLKSAFAAASSNAQNDTINLATNGTYTLTAVDNATGDHGPNGLPELGEAGFGLTVNGNGATIQRSSASGTPSFRLIYVAGNATVNNLNLVNGTTSGGAFFNADGTLTLGGCTFTGNAAEDGVTHGAAGGAIYNIGGTTNISDCTFTQNTANSTGSGIVAALGGAAIYNGGGGLTAIVNSTFSFNSSLGISNNGTSGGAIFNDMNSSVTVSGSTFTHNTSYNLGGAIVSYGTLTVLASEFDSNSVSDTWSGAGSGGAIAIGNNSTATIENSTFVANNANDNSGAGGAIDSTSFQTGNTSTTVLACTFYENGASHGSAIHVSGFSGVTSTLHLGNSIMANAQFGASLALDGTTGSIVSSGYNLSSDNGGGFLTGPADQAGADAKIEGLGSNGGPTKTCALLAGSAAINRGKSFGLTTDQRGQARPYNLSGYTFANGGDGSDIGAYEATDTIQPGSSLLVTNLADHDDGVCGDHDCTLREAINRVFSGSGLTYSITISPGLSGTLTLSLGELDVSGSLNLTGPGARNVTISGNSASRIFNFSGTSSIASTISGLTIRNGSITGGTATSAAGGGIYNQQSLTVTDCEFVGNAVTGGVGLFGGHNGALGQGGAIFSSGPLTLTNCTFASNIATGGNGTASQGRTPGGAGGAAQGAALYNASSANLTNCTFYVNGAFGGNGNNGPKGGDGGNGAGGAVANAGNITLLACTVDDNSANGGTGGTGSSSGNGAWGATNGGGLVNLGNTFKVTDTIVGDNTQNSSTGGPDADGAFVSGGYNLIGFANGGTGFTATGDMTGIPTGVSGPVSNTGGPTDTLTFLSSSAAINASNDTVAPHRDQRGYLRTGRSDIGAYENNGSLVKLISVNRSGLDLVIQAEVVKSKVYSLQRKGNITDSSWQTLLPYKTATGNDTETFTDPNAFSSLSRAFYEVSFVQ
jgi:fibronectin-binding autotransporter adhesin